jgi:hypothetical protein
VRAGAVSDQIRADRQPQDALGVTVPQSILLLADEVLE